MKNMEMIATMVIWLSACIIGAIWLETADPVVYISLGTALGLLGCLPVVNVLLEYRKEVKRYDNDKALESLNAENNHQRLLAKSQSDIKIAEENAAARRNQQIHPQHMERDKLRYAHEKEIETLRLEQIKELKHVNKDAASVEANVNATATVSATKSPPVTKDAPASVTTKQDAKPKIVDEPNLGPKDTRAEPKDKPYYKSRIDLQEEPKAEDRLITKSTEAKVDNGVTS